MKEVAITVEQYDNGYTLRWEDKKGEVDPLNKVVPEGRMEEKLGYEILEDIKSLMDTHLCNRVRMDIKYEPILDLKDQI